MWKETGSRSVRAFMSINWKLVIQEGYKQYSCYRLPRYSICVKLREIDTSFSFSEKKKYQGHVLIIEFLNLHTSNIMPLGFCRQCKIVYIYSTGFAWFIISIIILSDGYTSEYSILRMLVYCCTWMSNVPLLKKVSLLFLSYQYWFDDENGRKSVVSSSFDMFE